jgi:hypothetical protein
MGMKRWITGGALTMALLVGGTGAVAAAGAAPEAACFGQHVSAMAREHGGMANATEAHNTAHGTDLTVGEHQAHLREMGCMTMEE